MRRFSRVRFSKASPLDARRGMLGYVSLAVCAGLQLDGIALRRTASGRLRLSFPERRGHQGQGHPYIRPVDDEARQAIEAEVFAALGLEARP